MGSKCDSLNITGRLVSVFSSASVHGALFMGVSNGCCGHGNDCIAYGVGDQGGSSDSKAGNSNAMTFTRNSCGVVHNSRVCLVVTRLTTSGGRRSRTLTTLGGIERTHNVGTCSNANSILGARVRGRHHHRLFTRNRHLFSLGHESLPVSHSGLALS